jgi:hypothetical protein
MPIKQERMVKVLKEAEDCWHRFTHFRAEVEKALRSSEDAEIAFATIQIILHDTHVPSLWHTSAELEHFKRVGARNEEKARKMMEKRRRKDGTSTSA